MSHLHLEILPHAQRLIWPELARIPQEFTLYNGTAIALYLGHRESIDFDFFGTKEFDPLFLASALPLLANAQIIQSAPSTLTALLSRGTGTVKLSFFGVPAISRLRDTHIADNGLQVASMRVLRPLSFCASAVPLWAAIASRFMKKSSKYF